MTQDHLHAALHGAFAVRSGGHYQGFASGSRKHCNASKLRIKYDFLSVEEFPPLACWNSPPLTLELPEFLELTHNCQVDLRQASSVLGTAAGTATATAAAAAVVGSALGAAATYVAGPVGGAVVSVPVTMFEAANGLVAASTILGAVAGTGVALYGAVAGLVTGPGVVLPSDPTAHTTLPSHTSADAWLPAVLMIADSTICHIAVPGGKTLCFPGALVKDLTASASQLFKQHKTSAVASHISTNAICFKHSEELK